MCAKEMSRRGSAADARRGVVLVAALLDCRAVDGLGPVREGGHAGGYASCAAPDPRPGRPDGPLSRAPCAAILPPAAVNVPASPLAPPAVPAAGQSWMRIGLVLAAGIVAGASSAPMIKAAQAPPLRLAAGRLLLAALILAPLALVHARRNPAIRARDWILAALLPGIGLGLHFATWNIGVGLSRVADASLIGNLTPLVMPFLLAVLVHERLTRRELAATFIAVVGLVLRDRAGSPSLSLGTVICLAAMVLYAIYMTLARRHRALPSVWPYLTAVYLTGGLVCAALSPVFEPVVAPTSREWIGIVALAVLPTVVGHTAFNWAMRHVRGQAVALCGLLVSPLSALIAWIVWEERPGPGWGVAFICIAIGLVLVAWPRRRAPGPVPPVAA